MNLSLVLSKLGLSQSLTQDVTLLLVVLLLSFIFGISIGRSKLITILANIYAAFAIFSAIPSGIFKDYTYNVIIFLALIVALTLLSKKLLEVPFYISGSGFLWRVFLLSFLEVALVLGIIMKILPKKVALSYISASSLGYLTSPNMFIFWMVAPLLFVLLIHHRINR